MSENTELDGSLFDASIILDRGLFPLGQIVATPAALAACPEDYRLSYLKSHWRGFWGIVCFEDWKANDAALANGGRILSIYPLDTTQPYKAREAANTLWIITEADRSVTTLLLPSDY